jgi:hypothetical protein
LLFCGAYATVVHHEVLVLGIPGGLPLLYLTAAVGLGGLARWLAAAGTPLDTDVDCQPGKRPG